MTQRISINAFGRLRIAACFAIIVLHSLFASTVYFGDWMSASDVMAEKIAEHMLMWAVPVFLMITGALLLDPDREVSFGKLFGKYFRRIALALVCFTFIFQALMVWKEGEKDLISGWLKSLLTGQGWPHMWYLYLMISIYLMMPAYKAITRNVSDKVILYLIILCLVFLSIGPVLNTLGYGIDAFSIPVSTIYPVYLFIGYYAYRHRMKMPFALILTAAASAAIIYLAWLSAGGLISWDAGKEIAEHSAEYWSILVVLQAVGVYSIFLNIRWREDAIVNSIDKCTFGIYLIHMIGIRAVMKWQNVNPYEYGPFFFIALAIILFFISYFVTLALRKIPKLHLL